MIRIIVTIVACCLSFLANAKALEMKVSLSKSAPSNDWLIIYDFSEKVEAISFEKTPYSFIESDWVVQTPGAHLDLSLLHVKFATPGNQLSIALESKNDDFIRGFYTPFLNFSDGSSAIYVGHYIPKKIKIDGVWEAIEEVAISLTISPSENEAVFFNGKKGAEDLRMSAVDVAQYAYVGNAPAKTFEGFTAILDPALPTWIYESYLKAIPEFYNYYKTKTLAELHFEPLFIVNFKSSATRTSSDGGAINKQVVINFIGDAWSQDPDANRVNVLALLAHEMAHLWNGQYWHSDEQNPVWMHEGSANYFARKALLNFGYVSVQDNIDYYLRQSESCINALQNRAINRLENRADNYSCGDVVFKLAALMTGTDAHLDVWNQLVVSEGSAVYSEDYFIRALAKNSTDKNEANIMVNALRHSSDGKLSALIERYFGRSSNYTAPP